MKSVPHNLACAICGVTAEFHNADDPPMKRREGVSSHSFVSRASLPIHNHGLAYDGKTSCSGCTTLAGIPRLEDPTFATDAEHKAAKGNPPHRYIALDRVVMQGQVFICRAPSHEKAKKLAKILTIWPEAVEALREISQCACSAGCDKECLHIALRVFRKTEAV